MPYVITTRRPVDAVDAGHPDAPRDGWIAYRHAVATLEEARSIASDSIYDAGFQSVADSTPAFDLPESGGTVGPLPNGTVIEVARVGWVDLRESVHGTHASTARTHGHKLLDAYNARHA